MIRATRTEWKNLLEPSSRRWASPSVIPAIKRKWVLKLKREAD
jgi:hypothetical protein